MILWGAGPEPEAREYLADTAILLRFEAAAASRCSPQSAYFKPPK
jgi:hypothetical protein